MGMRKLLLLLLVIPCLAIAQKKQITLDDLYKNRIFRGQPVTPDFDQPPKDPAINFNELNDENGKPFGQPDDVIYNDAFPNSVLIRKNVESIYRYSTRAIVYYYDAASGKLVLLDKEKLMHPTLSPDGKRIAYVKNNNLYYYDIAGGTTKAITTDGKWNHIINGNCDWVYEEEFSFTQAYKWSPAGNYIAYYRFDESNVKEYEFTQFDDYYNSQYRYKYPKAGEDNSVVDIYIYNIASGQKVKAQFEQGDIYIPRIKWTQDDNILCLFWMNRHQNHLKLLLTQAQSGVSNLLYEEKNKYYIDINDDLRFLSDKKSFLFTSEMNGYQQIYIYSMDGKTKTQIHKGKFDVADVLGVDEKKKLVY
jgi:dipeptidyl-peptidase-4